MPRNETKQIILRRALSLFSQKGYDAVSVAEIAQAVGIKAPSLYKHYQSKQDIFDAILAEMARRYEAQASSLQMTGSDASADSALFMDISEDTLIQMGKQLFLYFLHDEYVCAFRKMLTVEQYHSPVLAALYTKQYADDPLSYQSMLFGLLLQSGNWSQGNAQITALHFYAPLYLLLTLCDRQPEREAEAVQLLEQHIRQFNCLYRKGDSQA